MTEATKAGVPTGNGTPRVPVRRRKLARAVTPGDDPSRFLNRELARLDFNARVLALAEDRSSPVLERAKFLAIFSSNLDELYQVRVAALYEQVALGATRLSPDGLTFGQQIDAIRQLAGQLTERRSKIFLEQVVPDLDAAGIKFSQWRDLDQEDRSYLDRVFERRIFPGLTPLAVDPAHPVPYISNLSLNLAVVVRQSSREATLMARVKVPPLLPRFVVMPDNERFVPVEQVIAAHLPALFPGMQIIANYAFRLTRQADFETDDEASDILVAVESVLRMRKRSPMVVRLEIEHGMSDWVQELLARELELDESRIYSVREPLDLTGLWSLYKLDRPDLKDEPWNPVVPPRLAPPGALPGTLAGPPVTSGKQVDIFGVLRQGDILVHHPYESFHSSVEAFVGQAADDPAVLAIKQTLYRTSSTESPIVQALIRAAESGKQAVALVELKARFDEEANIAWARALEEAGVHVVYGVVGLKTHAKTSLVVRQEEGAIRLYGHIGTGNYNPTTARLYEDLGLLTANPQIGADLSELFNYLTGYSQRREYRNLLVAPGTLRSGLAELIAGQAHPGGRLTFKVNNLADPALIDALYAAAQAGCSIDLVVRSVCCLRPGVPGLSDSVRVRSIVGRFLEHSRIYRFGDPESTTDPARYFIGSADLMVRNLDERVEAVAPILDRDLTTRLDEILEVSLSDDCLAWELHADGTWAKVPTVAGLDSQRRFRELARARAFLRAAGQEVEALV